MMLAAKLLGVLMSVLGLVIFASPQCADKIFAFFKEGSRLYIAGGIRLCAGLLLLGAASQSLVPLAAIALGLLFLVSAAVIFVSGLDKMKILLAHYAQMPPLMIRLMGLVAASFGLLTFSIF